jgi:two-component system sensor histidine kinase HydH
MKLPFSRHQHPETRRYFPIAAILAAVATLIVLLVIYTSRNLSLARHRLEDSLLQEGMTLIRAIEAGSRTGMRMSWAANHLQILVEEIITSPKIAYISVIGANGKILAHSQSEYIGTSGGIDVSQFTAGSARTRTLRSKEGPGIFEITTRIVPRPIADAEQPHTGMRPGMRHGLSTVPLEAADIAVVQLGMKMTELQQLENRDLRNAILMVVVLSVVGSAALYFIVFLQNYHAVNYAFHTMQSYAQHVVDSMANGLISLNSEGKIVTLNRQAHHILDIPPHKPIQGQALSAVLTLQECDLLQSLAKGERILEREMTCTTAAQRTIPLSLSASTLTDDQGQQLGTVLLFRDLSDVKALEEQIKRAERLASVGRLAAGVAHEIRNPLGSLKGFLQYFQRKLDLQEQDKTYLTVMVNEVDRLNSVIANLLEFARPKEPVFAPCDAAEMIHHVVTLIESDLQTNQIALSLDLEDNLPPMNLDRDQMTQVLLNLLLNAIQATAAGGKIHIAAKLTSHPDPLPLGEREYLELLVQDTGRGIAPEDLPKIFDPFFTTKKRGAGLGLAIAYTIIQNHHGEITVESAEGKGSAFRIRLPATN